MDTHKGSTQHPGHVPDRHARRIKTPGTATLLAHSAGLCQNLEGIRLYMREPGRDAYRGNRQHRRCSARRHQNERADLHGVNSGAVSQLDSWTGLGNKGQDSDRGYANESALRPPHSNRHHGGACTRSHQHTPHSLKAQSSTQTTGPCAAGRGQTTTRSYRCRRCSRSRRR